MTCDWWLWDGSRQHQCGEEADPFEGRRLCATHLNELFNERAAAHQHPTGATAMTQDQTPDGITFTRREAKFIDTALERIFDDYHDGGDGKTAEEVARLRIRIEQHNQARPGLPEERHEFHGQLLMLKMRDHGTNSPEFVAALQDYWTEILRMENRPAQALAGAFTQIAGAFRQGAALGIIQLVGAKLGIVEKRHGGEGESALAEELGRWIVAGDEAIQRGETPWGDDPDLHPPAPAGDSDPDAG